MYSRPNVDHLDKLLQGIKRFISSIFPMTFVSHSSSHVQRDAGKHITKVRKQFLTYRQINLPGFATTWTFLVSEVLFTSPSSLNWRQSAIAFLVSVTPWSPLWLLNSAIGIKFDFRKSCNEQHEFIYLQEKHPLWNHTVAYANAFCLQNDRFKPSTSYQHLVKVGLPVANERGPIEFPRFRAFWLLPK